jgi:succinylarginine dihydrolase
VLSVIPPVLSYRDMPIAELSALRLDGEVFPLGAGVVGADEPVTGHHRAAALGLRLPEKLIPERDSALWVHGFLAVEPSVPTVAMTRTDRTYAMNMQGLAVRETSLLPEECAELGGILVASLWRTLYDLAFQPEPISELIDDAMRDAAHAHPQTLVAALGRVALDARNPGSRTAAARLRALEPRADA